MNSKDHGWAGNGRAGAEGPDGKVPSPAGLSDEDIIRLSPHAPAWRVVPRRGVPRLERTFLCRGFSDAMWFVLKVGELAESANQRPTILIDWNRVTVVLRSADETGLTRGDFAMAARTDAVWEGRSDKRSDA